MSTPDFPSWSGPFKTQIHRLRTVSTSALHQFELLFQPFIPRHLLAQEDQGPHSRNRCWNLRLVFWSFLWQVAQSGASCREAIRQAQSLCQLQGGCVPPATTSPYCQARSNIPLERLDSIQQSLCREAEEGLAQRDLWCGHRVRAVDGTTATLADTPDNQKAFPQQSVQKPGCGFPILRLVALFSLATGLITAWVTGNWHQHELMLVQSLWDHLAANEVLLGDRGFCSWGLLAQCLHRNVHAVFRLRGSRRGDFRRGRHLSKHERLVRWEKPSRRPRSIPEQEWLQLPEFIDLRLVRCTLEVPGYRTRQVILVTTLLDNVAYPPEALSELYRRRWSMELTLRHLKTTLQMEHLSCMNPDNVQRELRMHLLVHNLVRRILLQAARVHRVPLSRMSFAGALASCRRYAEALLQTTSKRKRQQLFNEMIRVIADDPVPDRPGRREPRALKRRNKPYPFLTCHRALYKEIPHKNRYWTGGPCRRKRQRITMP
jgi:hypothetical protein